MKKIVAMAMAAVMSLSLAACGGSTTPAASAGGSDKTVYKITYANTVADSNPQAINAKYMAERMKELSGGRIEMTVFNNNKLGAFSDSFPGDHSGRHLQRPVYPHRGSCGFCGLRLVCGIVCL